MLLKQYYLCVAMMSISSHHYQCKTAGGVMELLFFPAENNGNVHTKERA